MICYHQRWNQIFPADDMMTWVCCEPQLWSDTVVQCVVQLPQRHTVVTVWKHWMFHWVVRMSHPSPFCPFSPSLFWSTFATAYTNAVNVCLSLRCLVYKFQQDTCMLSSAIAIYLCVRFDTVLLLTGHQSWHRTWRFVYNLLVNLFKKLHFLLSKCLNRQQILCWSQVQGLRLKNVK